MSVSKFDIKEVKNLRKDAAHPALDEGVTLKDLEELRELTFFLFTNPPLFFLLDCYPQTCLTCPSDCGSAWKRARPQLSSRFARNKLKQIDTRVTKILRARARQMEVFFSLPLSFLLYFLKWLGYSLCCWEETELDPPPDNEAVLSAARQ